MTYVMQSGGHRCLSLFIVALAVGLAIATLKHASRIKTNSDKKTGFRNRKPIFKSDE
jgi:hypothetical protein